MRNIDSLEAMFADLDPNGCGVIDGCHAEECFLNMELKLTELELYHLLNLFDFDNSGRYLMEYKSSLRAKPSPLSI